MEVSAEGMRNHCYAALLPLAIGELIDFSGAAR